MVGSEDRGGSQAGREEGGGNGQGTKEYSAVIVLGSWLPAAPANTKSGIVKGCSTVFYD